MKIKYKLTDGSIIEDYVPHRKITTSEILQRDIELTERVYQSKVLEVEIY